MRFLNVFTCHLAPFNQQFSSLNKGGASIKQLCLHEVWQEFRLSLKKFIRARVKNDQDCEDILQEVFMKIHHHLPDLKEEDKLRSWVYQITRNAIIDFYRYQAKSQIKLLDAKKQQILPNETDITYENNKNKIVATWLKDLMEQLPEKYKEALIYVELEQHTQKELAEKLGISLSGAKSRVQRGREKLKNILLDCCHLEFDHYGNILDYRLNKGNCSCREIDELKQVLRPF